MTRPRKKRSVHRPPLFDSFKPTGVPRAQIAIRELALDEFEAIRLADHEGLDQETAAERMGISRSTFSRLVEKARHKVAEFLIEGRHLRIGGGDVHFRGNLVRCARCGRRFSLAMDEEPDACPDCGSPELADLARGHGHGRCCRRHHRRRGKANDAE